MGHVHVIATQHLDVAWLWPRVPQGEDIMRQCFERAIAMIQAYPDIHFVFSRSTAWSFWIVEQRYPELFEKIRHYVQADRIELCGGEWVEPDHLIPSGESLVRQIILGQWYFQRTFGKMARVCWDPDIFGHAHSLPQIMKKSGLDGYYFHRCRPRDASERPLHQFIWEGPDGSRIFVLSGQWVGKPDETVIRRAAEEMDISGLPATHVVTGLRSDRRITMLVDWVPLPDILDQDPILPYCSWSTAGDVLDHMVLYQDLLPVVREELNFQYTGTYTSNGFNKRANRELEALLLNAEKSAAWAALYGFPYQEEQLIQAWRDLCVNQFHDVICGTSYDSVHIEDRHLFAEGKRRAQWIQDQALAFLGDRIYAANPALAINGTHLAVFDFATWVRTTTVVLPVSEQGVYTVTCEDDIVVPSQSVVLQDGSPGVLIHHVGTGIGYRRYRVYSGADIQYENPQPDIAYIVQDGNCKRLCLENDYIRAEFNPETGELVCLLNKCIGEEVIPEGGTGNRLIFLRDGGLLPHDEMHSWEPWNIMYTGERREAGSVTEVQLMEAGPLRGSFRIERRVQLEPDMPETIIVQDISLDRDSALVTFWTYGTWHARQTMLKASFDLAFETQLVAVDVPYGTAERPPNVIIPATLLDADTLAEDRHMNPEAAPEPDRYMQKWLDTSDGQRGVLFLNNGRYGYDAEPSKIGLSLLRAPFMRPERDEIIGLGPFSFTYAIMPHQGNWRDVDAPRQGYGFNIAPVVVPVQPGRNEGVGCGWWDDLERAPVGIPEDFLTISGHGVLGTVLKRAHDGDGLVLRLFESLGHSTEARLSFCYAVRDVVECDMLERNVGDAPCAVSGGQVPEFSATQVKVILNPFEIKTLRVNLKVEGGD